MVADGLGAGPDKGGSPASLFSAEIAEALRLIGAMFEPRGVDALRTAAPAHPALQQLEALRSLQVNGTIDRVRELELVTELADYFLDLRTWPRSATVDDFWDFLPDVGGRERIRRAIWKADQYEDALAEVDTWSLLRGKGLKVTLIEQDGLPDLRVDQESGVPVWGEVKSVRLGTSPRNFGNAVTNANRQLRKAAPGRGGILFVRITRAAHRASLDDRIPDDVAPYLDELRREISGQNNRSVGVAIVSWTDFFIHDDGQGRALHAFRRRAVALRHVAPHSEPEVDEESLDFGRTFVMSINYPEVPLELPAPALPAVQVGQVVVTPLFRAINEFRYGIRPQHAVEAMIDPDVAERMGPVVLALRRIPIAGYSLLLLAADRDGETHIMVGFKLYDDASITFGTPTAALSQLLVECGVPTKLGNNVALLHPQATLDDIQIESVGPRSDRGFVHAVIRRRPDGRFDVACAFAVDNERYERAMAPH